MAKIAVFGLGYVGITQATGLAGLGHSVVGVDIDEHRVHLLENGEVPLKEPGLKELLGDTKRRGLLTFSSSTEQLQPDVEFAFICVPTPSAERGGLELRFVKAAIEMALPLLIPGGIIVVKSTLPIGTGSALSLELQSQGYEIAVNPEFLSEGTALADFERPSRIVVGADSEAVAMAVMKLYESIEAPRMICSLVSAETIKQASNSFLAIKLSYVNELAALCE